jgi:hypothetical protein
MSSACVEAIPRLHKLGIRSEIWLGEDDSISSARYLISHAGDFATTLIALAKSHPGLVGFNLDLETSAHVNASELTSFSRFLTSVTTSLNKAPGAGPLRFSADVSCPASKVPPGQGTLGEACSVLAGSGVNRLMNMRTYNSGDFTAWANVQLAPALHQVPLNILGAGLGCWIDNRTRGTWNVKPESARERICLLMNRSVQEIDMFILEQAHHDSPPGAAFPELFWIPELEKFMAGGGCDAVMPPPMVCPAASIGPNTSWVAGSDAGCCTSRSMRGTRGICNVSCAVAECAAAKMVWKPENFHRHPYECCRPT